MTERGTPGMQNATGQWPVLTGWPLAGTDGQSA